MNWKFWQNKKTLAVTIAAAVVVVAGTAVTVALLQPKSVTQEQAQTIALEHAGVVAADAVSMKVDRDDGDYQVDFSTADRSYQYTIQGSNGKVVDYSYQPLNDAQGIATTDIQPLPETSEGQQTAATDAAVTEEEAKQAALAHAGLEEANVTFYRVKQDYENGRAVYEVEFYTDTTEYDYEIAQDTGEVLSYDSNIEDWAIPQEGTPVTLEQATQLVVDRVEGMTAQEVRIHQEHDDGRTVYEGEAVFQGAQYEFEIDAATGAFLDWSVESR